jgi:hypothetical protein
LLPEPDEEDTEEIRARCCVDLKWLYCNVIQEKNPQFRAFDPETGVGSLGKLHDILFDFLRWEELLSFRMGVLRDSLTGEPCEMPCNSDLVEYLPECGKERWIYWPTLRQEPEVYDGRDHEFAKRWVDGQLPQGVVVRLVGRGGVKGVYLPRGHLKSSIANVGFVVQEIARDPDVTILERTADKPLAQKFIQDVKRRFDGKDTLFWRLFGALKPEYKEAKWSQEAIQLVTGNQLGKEYTLAATPITVEATGQHVGRVVFDDVVGWNNLRQQPTVCAKVLDTMSAVAGWRDSMILSLGTMWALHDANGLFVWPRPSEGSPLSPFDVTSFMFATLRDAEDQIIWSEYLTEAGVKDKRALCADDARWWSQMFNNPFKVKGHQFKPEWFRRYEVGPECVWQDIVALIKAERLDLYITCDPAGTKGKDSDRSGLLIRGSRPDGTRDYVLRGFCEKLDKEAVVTRFCDSIKEAVDLANAAGTAFRFAGFEKSALTTWLLMPIREELRRMDLGAEVREMPHRNKPKSDRIWALAQPYSTNTLWWPKTLLCTDGEGKQYDLTAIAYNQFIRFGKGDRDDDVIDCQAMGEAENARIRTSGAVPPAQDEAKRYPDAHYRGPEPGERDPEKVGLVVPEARLTWRPRKPILGAMRAE